MTGRSRLCNLEIQVSSREMLFQTCETYVNLKFEPGAIELKSKQARDT